MARSWTPVQPSADPNQIVKIHPGLRNRDLQIVQAAMDKMGLDLSAALRVIINEWDDTRPAPKQTSN